MMVLIKNCDGKDDFDQDEDGHVPAIYQGIATFGLPDSGGFLLMIAVIHQDPFIKSLVLRRMNSQMQMCTVLQSIAFMMA